MAGIFKNSISLVKNLGDLAKNSIEVLDETARILNESAKNFNESSKVVRYGVLIDTEIKLLKLDKSLSPKQCVAKCADIFFVYEDLCRLDKEAGSKKKDAIKELRSMEGEFNARRYVSLNESYPSGVVKAKCEYYDGAILAGSSIWYENGNLMWESKKAIGCDHVFNIYRSNGRMLAELRIIDSNLISKLFYSDGSVCSHFNGGLHTKTGTVVMYSMSRISSSELNIVDGKPKEPGFIKKFFSGYYAFERSHKRQSEKIEDISSESENIMIFFGNNYANKH